MAKCSRWLTAALRTVAAPVCGRRVDTRLAARVSLGAVVLVLVAASLVQIDRAVAQEIERIRNYEVVLDIRADGSLQVLERIDYDFGTNDRHGIRRVIPERVPFNAEFDRDYPLDDFVVRTDSETPGDLQVTRGDGVVNLRIGDPDRTITGEHRYEIEYRVRGAITAFSQHEELFWNVTGTAWDVPIDRVAVELRSPTSIDRLACFAGRDGSRLGCDEEEIAAPTTTAFFSHDQLSSFEGLSVVAAMPLGSFEETGPILHERWSLRKAFAFSPIAIASVAGLSVAMAGGLWELLQRGRDVRYAGGAVDAVFGEGGDAETPVAFGGDGPYPVAYEPPEDLRPGQVGTLIDEQANPLDVTATIVDLAVRGYLTIEEIEDPGFFGLFRNTDWKLTRLRPMDDLLPYERILGHGLFEGGDEVLLSSLKQQFHERLKDVQTALYADVVARGWYRRSPEDTRRLWLTGGVVALIAGAGLTILVAAKTHLGLVPLPLLGGALVIIAAHRAMPSRTAKGTAVVRRAYGFRRFIETAERDQARFAERKDIFTEYLPYAVVFGATDRWARAFSALGEVPGGDWYRSAHGSFHSDSFAESVHSFSTAGAGIISSTPAGSSSGFGGGGGVGGGGGGGGGGSW